MRRLSSVKCVFLRCCGGQTLGIITFSIGISAFPSHATTVDELLRAADQALYNAKRQGRDKVVVGTDAFVLRSRWVPSGCDSLRRLYS